MRTRQAVLILSLLGLMASAAAGAEPQNACVSCHRPRGGAAALEHSFADWQKSVHARAGVACESCHGGDPRATNKEAAHTDLLPSTETGSRVYFTSIPDTCGSCHQAEFSAFKTSAHYQELQRSGKGPNCVTCHGSMANHILAPRELEMTCTLCHRRPSNAYATLMSLNNAGNSLKRLEKALQTGKVSRLDVTQQDRELKEARELYRQARIDWHTFSMPEVLKASQDITRRAVTSINELHIKGLQQHGTPKH